jgi:hypothetical protein
LPVSLEEQQKRAPKWRGGQRDGELPSCEIIRNLGSAVRQTEMLRSMERQNMLSLATKERGLQLGLNATLLDTMLTVLSEEALKRQAAGLADDFLPKAANALLKRADQVMERDRFEFDAAKACLQMLPELKLIAANPKLNEATKVNQIRLRLFGELPPEPVS